MAFEHKDNSGTLFKNDKKETESHPNAKGEAKIGGVMYWVAAWTKKDKNGNPWQSLSFTPKEQRQEAKQPTSAGKRDPRDLTDIEDAIPF